MANNTYSDNIKPMFFAVPFIVVVQLRRFIASTSQVLRVWKFSVSDCATNPSVSYSLNPMRDTIFAPGKSAFFSRTVFSLRCFTFVCMFCSIFATARLALFSAIVSMSCSFALFSKIVFTCGSFTFRAFAIFLVAGSATCYDGFRHTRFLGNRLLLGPGADTYLLSARLVYRNVNSCQYNFLKG